MVRFFTLKTSLFFSHDKLNTIQTLLNNSLAQPIKNSETSLPQSLKLSKKERKKSKISKLKCGKNLVQMKNKTG